jgi:hypothetical protein
MAKKRKKTKPSQSQSKKNRELQAIYDEFRRKFTAADLQKFTVVEKGVPAEKVLAGMKKIHREITRKRA